MIPVFAAIGRNRNHIQNIRGFEERALKILTKDMSQPNGGLFEMLVALAYKNDGAEVSFHPEKPGVKKTYDLDVVRGNNSWAVECKRMELGEYTEFERQRMRVLWNKPCLRLVRTGRSIYLNISFKCELSDVYDDYLEKIIEVFLESELSSKTWNDDYASGVIGDLDLQPIKLSLQKGYLLYPGPVYHKLLTGSYLRYDSLIIMHKVKFASNPHFIDKIDQAVVARWESVSEKALNKKARDIRRKLAVANSQLPTDKPGVIHIGIECLGADEIEHRRHEKIMETINAFDPGDANLHFIYCHYFSPESSPDETWAFDETTQWLGIRPTNKPLNQSSLVIPKEAMNRIGVHWDGEETGTYKDK